MTWVKICGITTELTARGAADAGADALGFVFWPGSRRCVDPHSVARMTASIPGTLARVGVWVDAPVGEMMESAGIAGLTHLQLHGDESPELVRELPLPVIKGVRLTGAADLAVLDRYLDAWAILVEPRVAGSAGGAGVALDLELASRAGARLRALGYRGRFILAGGLTPEGVAEAMARARPDGVDVSSGVELEGVKDLEKVRRFVLNCRDGG